MPKTAYEVMVGYVSGSVILFLLGYKNLLPWSAVAVLVGITVGLGSWIQARLGRSKEQERELIQNFYAPIHEEVGRLVSSMRRFGGPIRPTIWESLGATDSVQLVPAQLRKELHSFYGEYLPKFSSLFRRTKVQMASIVREDLLSRKRIQEGHTVVLDDGRGLPYALPFDRWWKTKAPNTFSERFPIDTVLTPDNAILERGRRRRIGRTYSRLEQVFELPPDLNDYTSELRLKAQGTLDVQRILDEQAKIVNRGESLLGKLRKRIRD